MKKKFYVLAGVLCTLAVIAGCRGKGLPNPDSEFVYATLDSVAVSESEEIFSEENGSEEVSEKSENAIEDGVYTAEFNTDSTMFHVNETCDGKGVLTVKDGEMTIHVSLPSKSIQNLFSGLAEDAEKDGAELLQPVIDEITYPDGLTEEVNGFDIPVPYLDDEFDVALIGKKGIWYDHKVSVSNPVPLEETGEESGTSATDSDISYDSTINVSLEGGSGKATITSPAKVRTTDDCYVLIVEWSSPNYDYMIVNEEKLLPVNTEGNSVFEIQFCSFDEPLDVIADTVAMSKPHEVEYTISFDKDSLMPAGTN
ncbi:MAG: iron transporter [Lachnospiraceae bacterium]|nr:iron transporter [Lachnospiraceae bacterium]